MFPGCGLGSYAAASWPAVADLAAGGALAGFRVREEQEDADARVALSCRHGGADVAVSASGPYADADAARSKVRGGCSV